MTYGTVGDRSSKTVCASFRSRRSRALAIEIESESESVSVSVSLWSRRVSTGLEPPTRPGRLHALPTEQNRAKNDTWFERW